MTADEAVAASPARRLPARLPVHVVWGADEPHEFRRQSRLLVDRWREAAPVSVECLAGCDHFDVVARALRPDRAPFSGLARA